MKPDSPMAERHPETTREGLENKGIAPDPRALELLAALRDRQRGLPRAAALAWERAAFAEALDHPEPRRRIEAFLGQGK